jgi:hypothetical protein
MCGSKIVWNKPFEIFDRELVQNGHEMDAFLSYAVCQQAD